MVRKVIRQELGNQVPVEVASGLHAQSPRMTHSLATRLKQFRAQFADKKIALITQALHP
jgi:hypothetical protein